jgi:shikimate kinase
MKALVLVGFMGAGKTEVGRVLAERLGVRFVDLDLEIERLEGKPVGRIFADEGEAYFRSREREVLQSLSGGDMVLSVGGGAYTTDDNISLISSMATAVWLDCPIEICLERCSRTPANRPLFSNPEEMKRLYKHRQRFYRRAQYRVDASSYIPDEVAEEIIGILEAPDRG